MRKGISHASEEYLEVIYGLEEKKGVAKTSDLAKQLNVALGAITNTIERLEKQGLIIHKPYRGVKLTDKGRKKALGIVRKHRLSERLLTDILHIDWSKAHELACKLEHSITKEVTDPLEGILGHPKTCPHGNPIPTEAGVITEEESVPLASLKPGERGNIVKISEERRDMLQYLATLGLMPGTLVEVGEKAPLKGPLLLKVAGTNYALGYEVASIIRVKKS